MKVEEYLEHGVLLQLDITVNVLWHGHLGAVDHLLDLDPEQLGDVQLGEDEDRPEDQDVDRQDDHVDVDSCQRLPRPEREHFPDLQSNQFLEIVNRRLNLQGITVPSDTGSSWPQSWNSSGTFHLATFIIGQK